MSRFEDMWSEGISLQNERVGLECNLGSLYSDIFLAEFKGQDEQVARLRKDLPSLRRALKRATIAGEEQYRRLRTVEEELDAKTAKRRAAKRAKMELVA